MLYKDILPNLDSLWKLMSEHNFNVDPDSIYDDLFCILCCRLIVDACQTRCGCQYCYKCIQDYLAQGDRYCAGNKPDCKLELLGPETSFWKDMKINHKILKTNVLCPNSFCQSKIELSKMEVHLKQCIELSDDGLTVGADILRQNNNSILEVTREQVYTNSELIWNNIKNEFDGFKEKLEKLRLENETQKEALIIKDKEIDEIGNMKNELARKEARLSYLERKLDDMNNERMAQNDEIRNMKDALRTNEFKMAVLENQMMAINNFPEDRMTSVENRLEMMNIKNDEIERKVIYYSRWNDLSPNADIDFAWKIEDLPNKKRQDLFSDPFYCNGYKLCLCMNISADEVALWCHIMRGDNDSNLDWPMIDMVTLSILDQDTLLPYMSESFQFSTYFYKFRWVFKRPKTNMNKCGIGTSCFVRYSAIKDKCSVIVNDSIVVSCVINDDD